MQRSNGRISGGAILTCHEGRLFFIARVSHPIVCDSLRTGVSSRKSGSRGDGGDGGATRTDSYLLQHDFHIGGRSVEGLYFEKESGREGFDARIIWANLEGKRGHGAR